MARLFLLFLLVFSSNSFAVDYYWYTAGYSSVLFSTPLEACKYNAQKSEENAVQTYTYHDTRVNAARMDPGQAAAMCDIYYVYENNQSAWDYRHPVYPDRWTYSGVIAYRGGNSCPAGTKFDPSTGECKSDDPCTNKPPMPFSKSGTAPDGYMKLITVGGSQKAVQSTEGCFDGCLASTTDQKCKTSTAGPYFCRGTAYFSGQSCGSSSPGVDSSESSAYPNPEVKTEDKPCNYVTNPDGTQSCTSSKSSEKEGQVCGTVSATGAQICVDKPPSKQGLDIATTVKTETDADGGKTTTKTDTATTTKCTDIKVCTSTTTTVITVVKPNGAVSGSCSGANCPDKNTNPDGDGDGFGDCATGDCGEGEGGGSPNTPDLGDVDTYQVTTQKFYDKVKASPIATSVNSISAPDGGTAPNFRTGAIAFLGGVSLDFSVIGQLWDGVADVLRLVMKAVWCFVAVVIFLMA